MANKNNAKYDFLFTEEEKKQIKQEYLDGQSIRDLCAKYNIKCKEWVRCKLLKGIARSTSESGKIAHKNKSESFKLSEEAKAKIRAARLKFMKEHPEQTAWRRSKKNTSYPEKCFIKYLEDRGIDKKYEIEREKSFFPYFADFAFNEIKLVVEIDGSQHESDEDRVERDIKKDELIQSLGWKVIRYTEDVVKHDWNLIDDTLKLENYQKIESGTRYGIFKNVGKYNKKLTNEVTYKNKHKKNTIKKEYFLNGQTKAQYDGHFKERRCIWPTKDELFELIKKHPFTTLAKKFGVSDKAITKWCKHYGLPYRKKDIKEIIVRTDS